MLANHEIVVIAAYLAGADSHRIDTEDIAVKANQIAPGRFSWRKYPEQINIDTVRKRLWDACKDEKGAYMHGSEKEGWLLTEHGVSFAKKNVKTVAGEKKRTSLKERAWLRTERARLIATEAFQKYQMSKLSHVTLRDAEGFFRIDNYVVGNAREAKILRILNAFSHDPDLGMAAKEFAELVRGVSA